MSKQLLFFDIDGTLVDSATHIIPESTREVLLTLRSQGHRLCIATGRSFHSLCDGGFQELIDWDAYLCNNGQAIYDHDHHLLHQTPIDPEAVAAVLALSEEKKSPVFMMGEVDRLTSEADDRVRASHEFFKENIPDVAPYDGTPVIMMIIYGDEKDFEEYQNIAGIDVIPGQSCYADVVRQGYHKFMGIQKVLEHFDCKEYIAFGDSLNDVEMLEHASIGIAMGNAHEELKKIADFVTENVEDDGIAHAVKKLQLL